MANDIFGRGARPPKNLGLSKPGDYLGREQRKEPKPDPFDDERIEDPGMYSDPWHPPKVTKPEDEAGKPGGDFDFENFVALTRPRYTMSESMKELPSDLKDLRDQNEQANLEHYGEYEAGRRNARFKQAISDAIKAAAYLFAAKKKISTDLGLKPTDISEELKLLEGDYKKKIARVNRLHQIDASQRQDEARAAEGERRRDYDTQLENIRAREQAGFRDTAAQLQEKDRAARRAEQDEKTEDRYRQTKLFQERKALQSTINKWNEGLMADAFNIEEYADRLERMGAPASYVERVRKHGGRFSDDEQAAIEEMNQKILDKWAADRVDAAIKAQKRADRLRELEANRGQ